MKKALIYCRVSSAQQLKDWNGLTSQEKRCCDYALSKWLEVEKVFNEEWVSGALLERKSINALFSYIDKNRKTEYVVIFDDLKRIARDVSVYLTLKKKFEMRWVHFESPNFKFEDSPEWRFIEVIMAGQAELEREQNRRQVIQKQRARLEQWYWCFRPPEWYSYTKTPEHWKLLVSNEDSKYLKQWLEKYAKWDFFCAADLARFLDKKWFKVATFGKNNVVLSLSKLYRILNCPLYAWYLALPIWDIEMRKAKHEWIISLQTYLKIQDRLNESTIRKKMVESKNERKDLNIEFPLRGFLYCEESKNSLSGAWSQWNSTKVAYYTYPRKSPMRGKSINRDKFHREFDKYLDNLIPQPNLVNLYKLVFTSELERAKANHDEDIQRQQREIDKKQQTIRKYFERIRKTESEIIIEWYEKEIETLEADIKKIQKNSKTPNGRVRNVWTFLEKQLKDVYEAKKLWNSTRLEDKIKLLKGIFPEWIPINKNRGVWTPKLSLIYQAFQHWKMSKNHLVELVGFEPTSSRVNPAREAT